MARLSTVLLAFLLAWVSFTASMTAPTKAEAQAAAVGPANPALKWKVDSSSSGPVVQGSDGTMYTSGPPLGLGQNLIAVSAQGVQKWEYAIRGTSVTTSPALGPDGTIYAVFKAADISRLEAIKPDGSQKWSFGLDTMAGNTLAVGPDGTIYVQDHQSVLYAVRPDGTPKWQQKLEESGDLRTLRSAPAFGADGAIYQASSSGLYAFNPDGSVKWLDKTSRSAETPVIAANGRIYSLSPQKVIMNSPDGSMLGTIPVQAFQINIAPDGTLVLGSGNGLRAYTSDGQLKWSFSTATVGANSHPVIGSNGTIYFGSFDEHIYAIDQDGQLKWMYYIGSDSLFNYSEKIDPSYIDLAQLPQLFLAPDGTLYATTQEMTLMTNTPDGGRAREPMYGYLYALTDQGGVPPHFRIVPDPKQVPATTGKIKVRVQSGTTVELIDERGKIAATGVTNSSGTYIFILPDEGIYTVRGTMEGYKPYTSPRTVLLRGQTNWIYLDMQIEKTGPEYKFLFFFADGLTDKSLEGVAVTLKDEAGNFVASSVSDADGAVYFNNNLQNEWYQFSAVKDGYDKINDSIGNSNQRLEFWYKLWDPPVQIKVVDRQGQPVPYAQINFKGNGKDQATAADAAGIANFNQLPPGSYKARVWYAPGYVLKVQDQEINVSKTEREFVIVLSKEGDPTEPAEPTETTPTTKYSSTNIGIKINGQYTNVNPKAKIVGESTFIPLRGVLENLGSQVTWNNADRSIDIIRNGTKVHLQIGNKTVLVNGVSKQLATAPFISKEGSTYVPLRFISEALGATVDWDSDNWTAVIDVK